MMTHVEMCASMNVLQAIRQIGQAWEAVEPSTIIKYFVHAGCQTKRNVVETVEPSNDEDPFADFSGLDVTERVMW